MGFIDDLKLKVRGDQRRHAFVEEQIKALAPGGLLLDAGAGSQRYRELCGHLTYRAQDFGQYKVDEKHMLGNIGAGGETGYDYGPLDYTGDIWSIDEKDGTFDAILCTEVFEHIPYPVESVREFSRLLKPGGKAIVTVPGISLRHFDPYYFYSGFSDRWFEKIMAENGFEIETLVNDGDYFSFMAVEIKRIFRSEGLLAKIMMFPALVYVLLKKETKVSSETLSEGVFVVARKV